MTVRGILLMPDHTEKGQGGGRRQQKREVQGFAEPTVHARVEGSPSVPWRLTQLSWGEQHDGSKAGAPRAERQQARRGGAELLWVLSMQ